MSSEELARMLAYFKAMADESRLKILGTLATRECSVEELSELLGIKGPTVSHHLTKLRELGLVTMRAEGNTHLHALDVGALHALGKTLFAREAIASAVSDMDAEPWERKVLDNFLEGERLKTIPAARKKREVVLRWLVERFTPEERYPEARVNELIAASHHDVETLRRELIGAGLMQRERGVYWRPASA